MTIKERILKQLMPYAERHGYHSITRSKMSEVCGVSPATLSYHFETMRHLQLELFRYAIKHQSEKIAIQAFAITDTECIAIMSPKLRKAIRKSATIPMEAWHL